MESVVLCAGLLPYACYLVRVSATNPVGRGDPSAILNIMTDTGGDLSLILHNM